MTSEDPRALRRARRLKTFDIVRVTVQGADHRAHLLDISTSGARLHVPAAIAAGATVTLSIMDMAIEADVIWAVDQRIGIRFHRGISEQIVERSANPRAA